MKNNATSVVVLYDNIVRTQMDNEALSLWQLRYSKLTAPEPESQIWISNYFANRHEATTVLTKIRPHSQLLEYDDFMRLHLMLFSVINVSFWKLCFIQQDVLRNESPDRYISVSQLFKQFCAAWQTRIRRWVNKHFQLHNTSALHYLPTQHLGERDGRTEGPPGGHQIVNNQHAVALLDLVALHRQARAVAVLRLVIVG